MRDKSDTKLSLFCASFIEAGWLVAAIVVPLLFNVRSTNIFELEKVSVLRSIALLMLLGAMVRASERQTTRSSGASKITFRQRLTRFLRRPAVLPALALLAAHVLSTAVSVWPHGSLWGSHERRQGLYATIAYVAVFLVMQRALRDRRQIDRLVTLIIVTGAVVSLYGLVQALHLDPMPWSGSFSLNRRFGERVSSTLGNPIFLAGYLIMVVPLALARAVEAASGALADHRDRASRLLALVFYASIVALHLAAIVLTQSRGPFIGLVGGLFFFLLLWMASEGRTRGLLVVVALAVAVGVFLIVANLPQSPLDFIRSWPFVGRLTTLVDSLTSQSRFIMWDKAVQMTTADARRLVVGYGPESTRVAFYPYLTRRLSDLFGPGETTSRFHNQTMDALVETGLIGAVAYLWVFGSLLYWGLRSLGLIVTRRQRLVFGVLVGAGVSLTIAGSVLLVERPGLSGLAAPTGMILAVVAYLLFFAFSREGRRPATHGHTIMVIALLSGIMAHFVEVQTGIAVTPTRSQLWLYAALVSAIASGGEQFSTHASPSQDSTLQRRQGKRRANGLLDNHLASLMAHSLCMGVLFVTLGFDFVTRDFDLRSLGVALSGLLLTAGVLGAAGFFLHPGEVISRQGERRGWGSALLVYSSASFGLLLLFIPFHVAAVTGPNVPSQVLLPFYLFLAASMISIAFVLFKSRTLQEHSPPRALLRRSRWWRYVALVSVVMVGIHTVNIRPVKADIVFAYAQLYQEAGRLDQSIFLYRRALELAPHQDHYYTFFGQAYARKAVGTQDATWFERAEELLQKAQALSPLRPDHHVNLGHLYYHWGRATADPAQRVEKLEEAAAYYERAAAMSPYAHGRPLESHRVNAHLALADAYQAMGQTDRVVEEIETARGFASAEQKAELEERLSRLRAGETDQ